VGDVRASIDHQRAATGIGGGTSAALVSSIGAVAGVAVTLFFVEAATAMNYVVGALIGAVIGYVAGLVFNSVRERSSEGVPG